MTPEILLVTTIAVFFAGFSKGGFGGSVAFVSSAILAIVMKPTQAVAFMAPLLILMDIGTLRSFWGGWDARQVKVLLIGSAPGMILGTLLFTVIGDDMLRILLAVIALGFVIWRLWPKSSAQQKPYPESLGYVAGGVAGFSSFVSHAGGPPTAMYLLTQGLSKTHYHATVTLVFWIVNSLKIVPYAFLGIFSLELFLYGLYMVPVAIFGVWLGIRAHHWIPDHLFFRFTYVCLALTSVKLIYDSVTN